MQKIDWTVSGMTCGSCVRRVRTALEAQPGTVVDEVTVGHVTASYDPDVTTPAALQAALAAVGYTAERVTP